MKKEELYELFCGLEHTGKKRIMRLYNHAVRIKENFEPEPSGKNRICNWCGINKITARYGRVCFDCTDREEEAEHRNNGAYNHLLTVQVRAFKAMWNSKYRETIRDDRFNNGCDGVLSHVKRQVTPEAHFIDCLVATCDDNYELAKEDNPVRVSRYERMYL